MENNNFKVGEFIKFSGEDLDIKGKKDKFSYVGQCIEQNEKYVKIDTIQGVMTLNFHSSNKIEITEQPSYWNKFQKNPEGYITKINTPKEVPPLLSKKEEVINFMVKCGGGVEDMVLAAKKNFDIDDEKLIVYAQLAQIKLKS